ncbi:hypothetical protein ABZS76_32980 [Streptomyces sp. NPDC005562]|uniref:hypothetical protein n=1 Tax=Streptomyces sp. NPDC005562 TaxID=3154890 RepID=UPI0033B48FC7
MDTMTTPTPGLRWERDKAGDALWRDEEFLGCIYDRDGLASSDRTHGWRALEGEDLIVVGDALPTSAQPNARLGARAMLEAHLGVTSALPSAQELLEMTALDRPVRTTERGGHV